MQRCGTSALYHTIKYFIEWVPIGAHTNWLVYRESPRFATIMLYIAISMMNESQASLSPGAPVRLEEGGHELNPMKTW